MSTYLATVQFTARGLAKYRDTTKRAAKVRADLKKQGVEVMGIYWAMGPADGFLLFRAADDESASAAMLSIAAQGNVRLTTTRLFDEREMATILSKSSRSTVKA